MLTIFIKLSESMVINDIPQIITNHSSSTFEMLFRKHDVIMLLMDSKTSRIIDVNDAALRFYGYSIQQMTAMKIEDISLLSREEIEAARQRSLRKEQIYLTAPHKLANGEIRTVEVHTSLISLEDKNYFFTIIHDITSRKKAEKALQESEKRYRDLFNNTNMAVFQSTPDGNILTANLKFAQMFGYASPEEVIATVGNAADLFADPKRRDEILRLHSENTGLTTFESLYLRKDGSIFTGRLNANQVVDSNNCLLFFEGFIEDITERKRAEDALIESELKYRTLFKSMGQGFYLSRIIYNGEGFPCDYRFIDVNSAFEQIIGLKKEQIIGKTYNELVPPDPESGWLDCFRRVVITGKPENYIFSSNIYNRYFEVYAFIPKEGQFCALVKDITESMQMEQRLEKLLKRLNLAAKSANLGIWDWDIEKNELEWDDRMYELYGIKRPDFAGAYEAWLACLHPDDRNACNEASLQALRGEKEYDTEFRVIWPDRTIHYLKAYGIIERDLDGKAVRMTGVNYDITGRKQAEEELKNSEDRFRKVFEEAHLGIVITSPSLVFEKANPEFCRMLGYPAEELKSMTFVDITHPDYLKKDMENVKKVGLGEMPFYQTEKQYIHKSGKVIWGNIIVSSIRDEHGVLKYYISMINDITERKQAEFALLKSEMRWRLSIENMLEGYAFHEAIFNADGRMADYRFLEFNPEAQKILNISRGEIVGKTALELYPHVVERGLLNRYADVMDTGAPAYLEDFYYTGDRLDKALDISCFRIDDSHFVCVFRDITARKHAEEKLRESEEKYRLLVQKTSDSIFSADPDGTYRFVNEAYASSLGYTPAEIIGKTPRDFFSPEEAEKRFKFLNHVFESGEKGHIDVKIINGDGEERFYHSTIEPFYDEQRKPLWALGIGYDITERKRAAEVHKKYEQQLIQNKRLESLGILAGGIAHDFNNLLGIIYGNLQLMSMDPDEKESAEYLASCLKTMNRAKGITTQLLTFSKGGAPVRKIGNLALFIRTSVQFALSGSNCISVYNIEEELWTVDYDESQIGQVFDNITINATQAMPAGGTLEVSAKNVIIRPDQYPDLQAGDYVGISFKDNGIGMPHNVLTHIFDPYFTTKATGRGLGLASVYSIVKNHDGYIEVESVQGKGSVFHIFLPASKRTITEDSSKPAPVLKKTGRILIMDDEPDLLKVLAKILKSVGCKTVGAGDGKEVIDLLLSPKQKKDPFIAVILDLTIPGGMGGIETVKEIRKFAPDLPVFVYSGYSNNDAMANPGKYGFTGSLKKPLERNELIELMNANI